MIAMLVTSLALITTIHVVLNRNIITNLLIAFNFFIDYKLGQPIQWDVVYREILFISQNRFLFLSRPSLCLEPRHHRRGGHEANTGAKERKKKKECFARLVGWLALRCYDVTYVLLHPLSFSAVLLHSFTPYFPSFPCLISLSFLTCLSSFHFIIFHSFSSYISSSFSCLCFAIVSLTTFLLLPLLSFQHFPFSSPYRLSPFPPFSSSLSFPPRSFPLTFTCFPSFFYIFSLR